MTAATTTTEPTLRRLVSFARTYAQNEQWSNAQDVLAEALDRLYQELLQGTPAAEDDPVAQWLLESPTAQTTDDCCVQSGLCRGHLIDPSATQLPPELQSEVCDGIRNGLGHYLTTFSSPDGTIETCVIYSGKRQIYSGNDWPAVCVVLPVQFGHGYISKRPKIQSENSEPPKRIKLSPSDAAKLAYLWAHLADAAVHTTASQYQLNQVVLHDGASAIRAQAVSYCHAVVLQPGNPWALAHLGDAYRVIANSWGPTSGTSDQAVAWSRLESYTFSIAYLAHAISQYESKSEEGSFWAYAHLGASIVNARAFVGHEVPESLIKLLGPFLHSPKHAKDDYVDLLDVALKLLLKAQELRGFYYPWAQYYYGGAALIKATVCSELRSKKKKRRRKSARLSTFATDTVADALHLQPQLSRGVFEPDRLYVNSYFEEALVFIALAEPAEIAEEERACQEPRYEYSQAWQNVWLGIKWCLKDNFLPDVQRLTGGCFLVYIASHFITSGTTPPRSKLLEELGFEPTNVPIPTEPIHCPTELFKFIKYLFNTITRSLNQYTSNSANLNTKVTVGLRTILCLLEHLLHVVVNIDKERKHSNLDDELQNELEKTLRQACAEIHAKLGTTPTTIEEITRHFENLHFPTDIALPIIETCRPGLQYITKKRTSEANHDPST